MTDRNDICALLRIQIISALHGLWSVGDAKEINTRRIYRAMYR